MRTAIRFNGPYPECDPMVNPYLEANEALLKKALDPGVHSRLYARCRYGEPPDRPSRPQGRNKHRCHPLLREGRGLAAAYTKQEWISPVSSTCSRGFRVHPEGATAWFLP